MPGRLFLTRSAAGLARILGARPLPEPAEPPRRNIAPGQEIVVLVADPPPAAPAGLALVRMRWGMIPVGRVNARGRPVMETIVNARGETLFDKSAFAGTARAVVPADGWYEWTGKPGRKTAWRLRPADDAPLRFAAITDDWIAPGGRRLRQVATVTCAPSPDVAPVHDRMGVLLDPADTDLWLHGPEAVARRLLVPWPAGRIVVEPADDVDFAAP
jgi:putative SOS response-associated peptidase YedK